MSLTAGEVVQLTKIAEECFTAADLRWSIASEELAKASLREKGIETPYPGVPYIGERPEVREYFVLMADMRRSTEHLRAPVPRGARVDSGLHRLYLETSGLLPTLSHLVRLRGGRVTEYLGDGVLAFTEVKNANASREYASAVNLGEGCLEVCNDIINDLLEDRYDLPAIQIGVGLSIGQAIITTMGTGKEQRPTAFGAAVYEASKLSKEEDQLLVSPTMEERWPIGTAGKRRFKKVAARYSFVGYRTWKES